MNCPDKDLQKLSIQGSLICIENGNCIDISSLLSNPTLSTTTIEVDKTFAEGQVVNTGTNFNIFSDVTTPYLFGATVTPVGLTNDTRLYQVRFNSPHPDGDQYVPVISGISNEPNGDEPKVNVVEGSITTNGFDVITTVDDNGGTEDPQVFLNFTFRVVEKVNVVQSVTLS